MKVQVLLILSCITFISSCDSKCSSVSSELWEKIDPYAVNADKNIEDLRLYLKSLDNHILILNCIDEKLDSFWLTHSTQVQLGGLISIIEEFANKEESNMICKLINKGIKYPDYYGLALSVAPAYFLCSVNVLKENQQLIARFRHPDGGKMAEYNVQENFIRNLSKATGKDFGFDYGKWVKWWNEEGKHLEYDKNNSIYKHN